MADNIIEITVKLIIALFFSGLIGTEREINQSSAGLKTHILVGISSTIIAIIQIEAIQYALSLDSNIISIDPVRLIAQVVSGIGFLGAGAIIVTRRTIQGLTTAASIWSVAALGLAIGIGSYWTASIGFLFVIGTLIFFKRVVVVDAPRSVIIKYLNKTNAFDVLDEIFIECEVELETKRLHVDVVGDQMLYTHVFRLNNPRTFDFDKLSKKLIETRFVVSIEMSDID